VVYGFYVVALFVVMSHILHIHLAGISVNVHAIKRRDIEMMGKKIKDLEDWIYYKFIFKVYKKGFIAWCKEEL